MKELLERHFNGLLEPELLEEITRSGSLKDVSQNTVLIDIGETVQFIPLVLKGAIKVMREDAEGDELLLYFIEAADTCAMTLSCCMGTTRSKIRAVAETDSTLVMIPVEKMEMWMGRYKSWQRFIIDSYHARMTELLETVDTIAFMRMDDRLIKYLRDKAMVTHSDRIQATHQEVAEDLHTSRVVVSRLLKKLEREGKLELNRNEIRVLDV